MVEYNIEEVYFLFNFNIGQVAGLRFEGVLGFYRFMFKLIIYNENIFKKSSRLFHHS